MPQDPAPGRGGGGGPYAVRPNASWVMVKWVPTVDRQIHICENITFPQLRWRMVKWVPTVDRQIHICENITFPQLRWRMVIIVFFLEMHDNELIETFLAPEPYSPFPLLVIFSGICND